MKLIEILKNTDCTVNDYFANIDIQDVIYDSRKALPDTIFVCIKGYTRDSHDLAEEVYNKGVRVFAVEKSISLPEDAIIIKCKNTRKFLASASSNLFSRPSEKLNTIGITGTKGKTSVSFMLKSIYEAAGRKVGIIGSTGIYIGEEFYDTANSTPESYLIHKFYNEMLIKGCDTAIIEATSQGFKLARTHGIGFNFGVFTNLSPDHIGENEHKDFDEYLECKKMIFSQSDKVIVNSDCEHYERIVSGAECPVVNVGTNNDSAVSCVSRSFSTGEKSLLTEFTYRENGNDFPVLLNTPGKFSVDNALLAIAVARQDGISHEAIREGLAKAFVKGRMEIVPTNTDYTVIIDFAHNEFSVKTLFDTIKLYNPKRIISVFGCGGNRSKLRRYGMGEVIGANSDLSIITSDNSRFEKVEDIISDILVGMHKTDGKYIIIHHRREAIKEALREAREGDVILLIGKGHESYEEIEGVQYPFDEREVVKTALSELSQQGD